jgi:Xaa-Pro dipeptidase
VDLDDRMNAVRERMASDDIDLLIATSNGFHTLDKPDPVAHLSGYRCLAEGLLLVPRDGTAVLIVSPATDAERVATRCSAPRCIATDDLASTLAEELRARNLRPTQIATTGIESLPYKLAARLLSLIGEDSRSFDNTLYSINPRKTNGEIERARRATAIAEKGFDRLIEFAREGMAESVVAVELNCFTKSLGADDNFLMLSASPHNSAVMPSSSRKLERGDILLVEFSPSVEGQFSQICRTVSLGPHRSEVQEKYDLVVRAMWAGIKTIRAGIAVSEVCNAIDRVLEAAGYGKYCHPPHIRRRGHGLGCGSVAPGDISSDNHTILEEGMLFVVHPNQYIPEVGYLLCGESVRVTGTGCEILAKQTAKIGIVDPDQAGSL